MRILNPIKLLLACTLLTACPGNNLKSPVQKSLDGHSRADYMTNQVMQGDFAGAIATGVTPPSYDCYIEPILQPTPEPVIPIPKPQAPQYPAPIEELIKHFPDACGFNFTDDTPEINRPNCKAISQLVDGMPIEEVELCITTQCVFSSMFALIYKLRTKPFWPEIKNDFKCTNKAYNIINSGNGVLKFGQEYPQVGSTTQIHANEIDSIYNVSQKPKAGDLIRLQRNASAPIENSAHSGIFSHYQKSTDGKISKICYWSSFAGSQSNNIPSGHRVKCEPREHIQYIEDVNLDGQ